MEQRQMAAGRIWSSAGATAQALNRSADALVRELQLAPKWIRGPNSQPGTGGRGRPRAYGSSFCTHEITRKPPGSAQCAFGSDNCLTVVAKPEMWLLDTRISRVSGPSLTAMRPAAPRVSVISFSDTATASVSP